MRGTFEVALQSKKLMEVPYSNDAKFSIALGLGNIVERRQLFELKTRRVYR